MIPLKQTMEITKGCLGGVFMVGNHIFRNSVQRLHGELVFCGTRCSYRKNWRRHMTVGKQVTEFWMARPRIFS